jgi:IPT/TIG domain
MNLKRFTRRAAGIGAGVALLMLGLEAPAMAISSVTAVAPSSGPAGCVVDITGTGFTSFPQNQQNLVFVGPLSGSGDDVTVAQADWFALSSTEIWAVVPALTAGTNYTVQVTDPSGTNTAGGTFLGTGTAAGGCAPTIASFTPVCGTAGDVVTITGTNLLGSSLTGGDVFFSPYAAAATQPVPDMSEPTSIQAIVPSDAADGPIEVLTAVDTDPNTAGVQGVFSATDFQVPPPDCAPVGGHGRSITLKLKGHLVAKGKVSLTDSTDTFTDCIAGVPVKIQRKASGHWKTVGKTTTTDTGAYKKGIKNKHGKYRSLAPKVTVSGQACSKAKSRTVTH